jgi:hypothetical protein
MGEGRTGMAVLAYITGSTITSPRDAVKDAIQALRKKTHARGIRISSLQ